MNEELRPRISILAMGFSWGAFMLIIIFILSFWCSLTGFGEKFLALFNSINPNPYQIIYSYTISTWSNFTSNILGILINSFYALVDGLIIGILLGFFYNFSLKILERKLERKKEDVSKEAEEGAESGTA